MWIQFQLFSKWLSIWLSTICLKVHFALWFEILTIRHPSTRLGGASEPKAQHTQRLTKLLNILLCKDVNSNMSVRITPKDPGGEIKAGEAILWGGRSKKQTRRLGGAGTERSRGTKQHTRRKQRSQSLALLQLSSRCYKLFQQEQPSTPAPESWDVISGKKYAATTKQEFSASQKDLLPLQASCEPRTWGWS